MRIFRKKVKPAKTTYLFCGIPVWVSKPQTRDICYDALLRINKFEYCAMPDILTQKPAKGLFRELQLANLKLMLCVDKFCRKHKIRYWADYGTLLGAIRHHDFIPWDDDIDIGMLRADYDKFYQMFNEEHAGDDIEVVHHCEKNGSTNMLKVRHKQIPELWVDIFPYDLYSHKVATWAEKIQLTQQISKLIRKNRLPYKGQEKASFHHDLLSKCHKTIFADKAPASENNKPDIFPGCEILQDTKYAFFFDYDTIFPLSEVTFCGHKIYAPADPDTYLVMQYGDYMVYPAHINAIHTNFANMPIEHILAIKKFIKEK